MLIYKITNKFHIWEDGKSFVVTTRKRVEVCRGSLEDCLTFVEKHPYGVKKGETL